MNTKPKISIIVPVYNVENYISKCLKSIINQSYKNLEIIVVNDGSTDRSGHICNYYSKIDKRVILINQKNQGLSMARNNALDIASGEYIGFVDSDDWVESDMFSTLYENAVVHNADIAICNATRIFDSEKINLPNKIFLFSKYNNDESIAVYTGVNKFNYYLSKRDYYVWNKLYKRYLFNNVRFPSGKLFEDIFTTYKLIDNANRIVITTKSMYNYVYRTDSITERPFSIDKMAMVEAHMEIHKHISNKYPHLEKACRNRVFLSLIDLMYQAYSEGYIDTH